MKMKDTIKMQTGGMWEGEWEIRFNVNCQQDTGITPCKHCGPVRDEEHKSFRGHTWIEKKFICPRVVVALNEGGYNSTGVCLDCILEAAIKLPPLSEQTVV